MRPLAEGAVIFISEAHLPEQTLEGTSLSRRDRDAWNVAFGCEARQTRKIERKSVLLAFLALGNVDDAAPPTELDDELPHASRTSAATRAQRRCSSFTRTRRSTETSEVVVAQHVGAFFDLPAHVPSRCLRRPCPKKVL